MASPNLEILAWANRFEFYCHNSAVRKLSVCISVGYVLCVLIHLEENVQSLFLVPSYHQGFMIKGYPLLPCFHRHCWQNK